MLPQEASRNQNEILKPFKHGLMGGGGNALQGFDVQPLGLSHCRSQDSVIITCCVLQMAMGECIQPIQAGCNLPEAPVSSSGI